MPHAQWRKLPASVSAAIALAQRFTVLVALLPVAVVLATALEAAPLHAAALAGRVEVWEQIGGKVVKLSDQRNAVIFVAGFREAPDGGRQSLLIQKNKSFSRRVLVITQEETVEFPNHDPIFHNVWSKSRARSFDLGLFKHPDTKPVQFPKLGIVTVFCNIHAQMIATILVLPNNRFAVTGAKGEYRIEGIPAGRYPVYAWVEGAKPVKQMVAFTAGKRVDLSFRLKLRRIPIRHLNKEGKRYKKYTN